MEHETVSKVAESRRHLNEQESSAIFKKVNRPIELKFNKVEYSVKVEGGGCYGKKDQTPKDKQILKGISGAVFPGELLAMLGPSGSGKTTLLTALGGRLETGRLRGSITYNDDPFSSAMKHHTGFVTQDDIMYPHLTVTETLVYTALLRLPNTIPKQEKIELAKAVMSQLGLTRCKDSIIGQSGVKRGVSGGEKKRVSIGQEMLINPSLLFLDEPTSGLDSTTALMIVSTVCELVKGGRTVVMTIHQPSSKLFYMFDKVLLLSEGHPLYFGKGSETMDYFESIGYKPEVEMNPSDFLLDIANGIYMDEPEEDVDKIKANVVAAYTTNLAEKVKGELLKGCEHAHFQEKIDDKEFGRWTTTWWQQFSVLLERGLKEKKHEAFSKFKITQVLLVALLTGLVWWQCPVSNLQDQVGLIFHIAGFWFTYPVFEALFTFPQDRMMLEKERASGMYRLSSYFMSIVVCDLPMGLILPTIFIFITYFMAGLKASAWSFIYFLVTILLSVLVGQGMGLAIGATVLKMRMAATVASLIMLTFGLLGGYFIQNLPIFISWIKYLSINHYTFKLSLRSQYEPGQTFACGDGKDCLVEEFPSIKPIGLGDQGVSWMALLVMLVGFRLIAYIGLMRIGRSKIKSN